MTGGRQTVPETPEDVPSPKRAEEDADQIKAEEVDGGLQAQAEEIERLKVEVALKTAEVEALGKKLTHVEADVSGVCASLHLLIITMLCTSAGSLTGGRCGKAGRMMCSQLRLSPPPLSAAVQLKHVTRQATSESHDMGMERAPLLRDLERLKATNLELRITNDKLKAKVDELTAWKDQAMESSQGGSGEEDDESQSQGGSVSPPDKKPVSVQAIVREVSVVSLTSRPLVGLDQRPPYSEARGGGIDGS